MPSKPPSQKSPSTLERASIILLDRLWAAAARLYAPDPATLDIRFADFSRRLDAALARRHTVPRC